MAQIGASNIGEQRWVWETPGMPLGKSRFPAPSLMAGLHSAVTVVTIILYSSSIMSEFTFINSLFLSHSFTTVQTFTFTLL